MQVDAHDNDCLECGEVCDPQKDLPVLGPDRAVCGWIHPDCADAAMERGEDCG